MKWEVRTNKDTTWEDEISLQSQYPWFSFENKTVVEGGSNNKISGPYENVTAAIRPKLAVWRVYTCRGKKNLEGEVKQYGTQYQEKLLEHGEYSVRIE